MNTNKIIPSLLLVAVIFSACEFSVLEKPSTDKKAVFDAFWNGIDTRYTYFELKNIDWDAAYVRFSKGVTNEMTDEALFDTLSVMIDMLKDGHSGIKAYFNEHKYIGFYRRGPENFDERLLVENYAKGWGSKTGSLRHTSLNNGQIAYIHYADFSDEITDYDIDYLIEKYSNSEGIIIDVRNNFGGSASNIFKLVKRFIHTETHLFDSRLKNGPMHTDFTAITASKLKPSTKTYNGKVCVLTNRKVYSAASVFALAMREVPDVTLVGDTTGGGLGLPIGFELPNGWQVHCAGSQLLSVNGENLELGIPPDVQVDMTKEDMDKGVDSIIEKAIEVLLNNEK